MKKVLVVMLCSLFIVNACLAQGIKADFDKAKKSGKSIYLVVTDKSAKGTDDLMKLIESTKKTAKNTVVIKLDRDDKANAEIVTKYRLGTMSLPMVLVVASNGVASGGLSATEATAEKLLLYLPTRTQADVLLGFENGKAALIVCGKKNAKDKEAIIAECKTAVTNLGNKAGQYFIDVDSKEETNFLSLLKPDLTKTTVLIFNGKGQFVGTLESGAKAEELVKTVNKKVGGCSPGGCGGKKC